MNRLWAMALGLALLTGAMRAQTIEIDKANRTIAVTAADKAVADADLAVVHIGFQVYGPDEVSTYALGSKTSNAIASALKKAGIPGIDIQGDTQSIGHNQEYRNDLTPAQRASRQFVLEQSWTVNAQPKDAAGVLHTAIMAGANQSGRINWQYRDISGLQAKAAALALSKAETIARQMAQGLGVKLGALIYASNQAPENGVVRMDDRTMVLRQAGPPPAIAPLSISPTRIEEPATVYAVFAIE